ncbi:uncharacterized protein [Antedon mediterranea]
MQNKDGNTPLHVYLSGNYDPTLEMVTCLLNQDASTTLQNKDGNTPLHVYLGDRYHPTLEMVAYLKQHGAPVTLQNKEGNTPISVLKNNKQIQDPEKNEILNFFENLSEDVEDLSHRLSPMMQ